MSDPFKDIVDEAMRGSRDRMLDGAIEMCRVVYESGGCAMCCVQALEKWREEMHAGEPADRTQVRH